MVAERDPAMAGMDAVQALVAALQQLVANQNVGGGDGGEGQQGFGGGARGDGGGRLLSKYVAVDKFGGEQDKWDEWAFAFKRAIRSQNKRVYDALVAAEQSGEDLAEEVDLDPVMEQRSGELYDILCQVCVGEALVLVRSVEDLEGIRAWQVLWRKYNPKTWRGA